MFVPSEAVSEVVAHFIGYFEIRVEESRLRHEYQEFWGPHPRMDPGGELPQMSAPFHQSLRLGGVDPSVNYRAPSDGVTPAHGIQQVAPPFIHLPGTAQPFSAPPTTGPLAGQSFAPHLEGAHLQSPDVTPLSAVYQVQQTILLDDNDVVVIGNSAGSVTFAIDDVGTLSGLVSAAISISGPLTDLEIPHDAAGIANFIRDAADVVRSGDVAQQDFLSRDQTDINGTHLNGDKVEEAPLRDEFMPSPLRATPQVEGDEVTQSTATLTPLDSINATSGANTLSNEAVVVNGGLSGKTMVVMGDVHQIDAVVQVNAYSDNDVGFAAPTETTAVNLASLIDETHQATQTIANPFNSGPTDWHVSTVHGDVVFFSWTQQYSFAYDQDTLVLGATGSSVNVSSGENTLSNVSSFLDLGRMYDLIIVQGDVWDGNFIIQTNVLYDDDTLAIVGEVDLQDSVQGSGNLLWNEATIHNIGAPWSSEIPDVYVEAGRALSAGDKGFPEGLRDVEAMTGAASLRVLNITGSLFDLQLIRQTNILGDADRLAVVESALRGSTGTTWDIHSGENALVNVASIVDYDLLGGDAYVAGELYSEAMLVQADIIDTGSLATSGDALVFEAIAFLDSDHGAMLETEVAPYDNQLGHATVDGPSVDIMQSVLA